MSLWTKRTKLYTAHLLKSEINIRQKICDSNSFSQNKNTIGILIY